MFLGTPHGGSNLALFVLAMENLIKMSLVKPANTSNLEILKHDSQTLAAIQESFSTYLMGRERSTDPSIQPTSIHCGIEEKPVMALGQVSG